MEEHRNVQLRIELLCFSWNFVARNIITNGAYLYRSDTPLEHKGNSFPETLKEVEFWRAECGISAYTVSAQNFRTLVEQYY